MHKLDNTLSLKRADEMDDSIRSTILQCYKGQILDSSIFNERLKNGGVSDRLLNSSTVMPNHIYIWGWFEDLINCRKSPISQIDLCEMEAYFRLMDIETNPAEIEMLLAIDRIFIEIMSEENK